MKKLNIRLICMLIVCTLIFSIPVSSSVTDITENESKISDDLREAMDNSDDTELIDIYFTIKTLDIDSLKNKLSSIYKFDYDEYQDPESCKELLVPEVLAELKASSLYRSVFKDISFEDYKTMNATESNVNFAILEKINEWMSQKIDFYRDAKIEIYSDYYNSTRDYIKHKYEGEYYKEIGRFGIVSITRAKATKEVINKICQESFIESLTLYKKVRVKNETSIASTQIGADSSTGTKSILYNSPYNGNNVVIGVIEGIEEDENGMHYGRFDPSNKQLQTAISADRLHYVPNGVIHTAIDDHATLVVSEIIGSKVSVIAPDGRIHVFEGVVPKSTVYQTNFDDFDSLSEAIDMLVEDYKVSVINLSAYIIPYDENNQVVSNTTNYEIYDNTIDQIVREHGISFIKSAGNNGEDYYDYISRPGKAFNIITVGAVSSKSSILPAREALLTTPFSIADYSSTLHSEKNPQKPDIVAPGSYITGVKNDAGDLIFENDYASVLDGGTSFAAPLVTGIAAQVIQADPTLKSNGTAVKAIILGGADKSSVNTSYSIENHLSNEAGVGMVNSLNSVERADSQTVFSNSFNITSSGCTYSSRDRNIELTAGKTVRIAMTYNKVFDNIYLNGYPNKLKVQLYYGNTLVADSIYSHNNVKIIEYTVPTTGTYTIRVSMTNGYEKPTSGTVYQQYAVSYGYK